MDYPPYVSTAQRRQKAAAYVAKQRKRGKPCDPILPNDRRAVAETFWGKAWCSNLEAQADIASRLPRGRSYVKHGAVVHLEIEAGRVLAQVQGSSMYQVEIEVAAMTPKRWASLVERCHGQIDSLLDLLNGTLSSAVMKTLTQLKDGILPRSGELSMACSCPDGATMCKHVAAVLYGIGARLDSQQELLFTLRQVDPSLLVTQAAGALDAPPNPADDLGLGDLAALFDIDMGGADPTPDSPPAARSVLAVRPVPADRSAPKKRGATKNASSKQAPKPKPPSKRASTKPKPSGNQASTKSKPSSKQTPTKKRSSRTASRTPAKPRR